MIMSSSIEKKRMKKKTMVTRKRRFTSSSLSSNLWGLLVVFVVLCRLPSTVDGSSCSSLDTCESCSNTYSCHWCEFDDACHAKGSIHGCSWGETCHKKPEPPKDNSTCASHDTCSDCALSSHFCHWCEQDNACHAVGSRYGCAIGVDCYSNDRCRRKKSEPIPSTFIPKSMTTTGLTVLLVTALLMVGCLSCCHYCATNVKGAYDDLATITMAASVAPLTVVGGPSGHYFTTLDPHPEEENHSDGNDSSAADVELQHQHQQQQTVDTHQDPPGHLMDDDVDNLHHSPYYLMNDNLHNVTNQSRRESRPLLHPSFNDGSIGGMAEPLHMKKLYRTCSIIYYISVFVVLVLVGTVVVFFPQRPVYNVCNDSVAWKRIMSNLVSFQLSASFEILLSLQNPNRVVAALDRGKGSFKYDGKTFGTYDIPPVLIDSMSITDLMLIARVTPDKYQALEIAEAYYLGKLILEAEFEGTVRIPALFDYTFDVHVKDIIVNVTELSDRSLCHCPTWDDEGKNHSGFLTSLFEG